MLQGTSHTPLRPVSTIAITQRKTLWGKLDVSGKRWMYLALAIFVIATAFYVPYALHAEDGPRGGSLPGLAYGIVGSITLLVPMLIPLRNRIKALRRGKPVLWMQAHVWFGTISYPLALYHAGGLIWHGALALVLMWVFTALIFSGIASFLVQRALPTATALHALTGDRRHAARQRRLTAFLNGWLFVHVPLAYTMLVLVVIHAVMSIRFTSPG